MKSRDLSCAVCGRTYISAYNCRRHLATMHPNCTTKPNSEPQTVAGDSGDQSSPQQSADHQNSTEQFDGILLAVRKVMQAELSAKDPISEMTALINDPIALSSMLQSLKEELESSIEYAHTIIQSKIWCQINSTASDLNKKVCFHFHSSAFVKYNFYILA